MRRQGRWYWWAVVLISSLTTGTLAVVISLQSQAESNRKICAFVESQQEAWTSPPPSTPTGRSVAESLRQLRRDLCS